MSRLIDADAFEAELNERLLPVLIERYGRDEALRGLHFSFRDCICNIRTQPTIEPEPDDAEANYWHEKANSYEQTLVKLAQSMAEQLERKKGRWIPQEDENGEPYGDKCSECGARYVMPEGKTNYCPVCGARMEGER